MQPAKTGKPRLLSRRRRIRLLLLWAAFGLAAVAIAFAVFRLYAAVQREIREQSEAALHQQRERFQERARVAADALRVSTIKSLASFHSEGLAYAMRQWDDSNASVVGTFQWDEAQGFLPAASPSPAGLKLEDVPALWKEFRAWREKHPSAASAEPMKVGVFRVGAFRTLDNPQFPATELGYQLENLDLLTYAGRVTDPWAGWAAHRTDASTPWIFWYQPGPGAVVRGCLVDVAPLLAQLRGELGDSRFVRLTLVPLREESTSTSGADLAATLPGFALHGEPGDLFVEKQGEARLVALAIGALLGVFLLGAVFLGIFSQRELRDAENKTTFVTQVSHELRTPITSIRMFADMLAQPDLPDEKRARFAGTISRESERLGGLIERLLQFSALAKGGQAVEIATIDVGTVVRETLEAMDVILSDAAMRVETTLPTGPVFAATDASALKQALLNLLENAVKYARAGGVVRVELAIGAKGVRVRVSDEGPGIPSELGARVFEPFVQGGNTLTEKAPGVGLGLSIARDLLRRADGDLVLVPSPKGAVFEIRLPLTSPA